MTAARTERAAFLVVGGLLALMFLVWAVCGVAGWTLGTATHREHRVIPGPVAAVRIDGSGHDSVVVAAGDGERVTVDSVARGTFRAPHLEIGVNGASIHVAGGCGHVWLGHCHASVTVRVPPGTAVEVDSGVGDVAASGLSGPVRLRSGAGDVSASELTGPAELHTGSGDVDAHDLTGTARLASDSGDVEGDGLSGAATHASSGSGDVDLLFSSAPAGVDAESGSGDVALLVPRGTAYAVDAGTSSGDRTVGVDTSPRSGHSLRARTGSGDVTVEYGS